MDQNALHRPSIDNYLAVGAIDFGTSYSGYAYSFRNDPQAIVTNVWFASGNLSSDKTPTCILFDKDKKVRAFGFEAEDAYANCCLDNEQKEWYFFRQYKMALYEQMRVSKKLMFNDAQGRPFPLFTLVTETIRYLKDELIKSCKRNVLEFSDTDIRWVLTVPAIWSDAAKNFMREAAENAGLPGYILNICLEPEAAAIFCKTVPCKISSDDSAAKLACFQEGDSYFLFDAGGGTIDIIVHQVGENGALKELHPACGGNWGGTMVDEAFLDFLKDLAGKEAMDEFRCTDICDFHDVMREFENKKKNAGKQSESAKLYIRIPVSLQNSLKIQKAAGQNNIEGEVELIRDKLIISSGKMHDFFLHSKEAIQKYLENLFSVESLQCVDNLFMVGGYSESVILQKFIRETFQEKAVIIPSNAGLAVLKGAVLYGHDPSVIAERRCRFTYGLNGYLDFDATKHRESTKITRADGVVKAKGCFSIHVKVGQTVKTGTFQPEHSLFPSRTNQTCIYFSLYACPRENPVYVTEHDCFKIGKLKVDISDLTGSINDKEIQVALCFGGTEITIRARTKQTGDVSTAKIQYDW